MSFMLLGILNSQVDAGGGSDYEFIAKVVGNNSATSLSFTNIPVDGTYKHLQIRFMVATNGINDSYIRLNPAVSSTYNWEFTNGYGGGSISGSGSSATGLASLGYGTWGDHSGAYTDYAIGIIDIFNYSETGRNPSFNYVSGHPANQKRITYAHVEKTGAAQVTEIELFAGAYFTSGTEFVLYGVKG